jgi:hypothetical protein
MVENLSKRQKTAFGKSFGDQKLDITDKIAEYYIRENELFLDKIDCVNIGLILFKHFQ